MSNKALVADLSILGIAIIWGFTFPMVQSATSGYPIFSFLAVRFAIASLVLLMLTWRAMRSMPRKWVAFALLAGLANFAGYAFQTYGMRDISPGRTAFITGFYGAMVPITMLLLSRGRQRITKPVWIAIALSMAGLACLFWKDVSLSVSGGDGLVLICAACFALQIVMVGMFPRHLDPKPIATFQAIACCLGASLFALVVDRPMTLPPADTFSAAVFLAVFATALALFVQAWAQKRTSTVHAGLIFCTEPVWGGMAGVLLVGEVFTPLAIAGCVLMLMSMMAPDVISLAQSRRAVARSSAAVFDFPLT